MLNTISLNQHWDKNFYENAFKDFKCLKCNESFDEINFSNRKISETFGGTELLYFFKNKNDDDFNYCSISFNHRKCNSNLSFSYRGQLYSSFSFLLNKRLIKVRSNYHKDFIIENNIYFDDKSFSMLEDYFITPDQAIKYLDNLIFT